MSTKEKSKSKSKEKSRDKSKSKEKEHKPVTKKKKGDESTVSKLLDDKDARGPTVPISPSPPSSPHQLQ